MGKYVYSYTKICEVCQKEFATNRYATKICSDICVKEKLSQQKRRYTDAQADMAIELRKNGMPTPDISDQTGINIPSLKGCSRRAV